MKAYGKGDSLEIDTPFRPAGEARALRSAAVAVVSAQWPHPFHLYFPQKSIQCVTITVSKSRNSGAITNPSNVLTSQGAEAETAGRSQTHPM